MPATARACHALPPPAGPALRQCLPQPELATHAEDQPLQLEQPAEWRVPDQFPVELEAAELLRRTTAEHLEAIDADAGASHQLDQRLTVLVYFQSELIQEAPELRAAVARRRATGQLAASGGPGEMV